MGAVAQHRHAVGKLEHFLHAVADVDDRHPFALQAADQLEQLRRFLAGQIGGRLVEDQELGAAHRGTRGCDQLLLADGQLAQQHGGRQSEAEIVEHGLRHLDHLLLAHQAERVDLVAEKQVGSHRQMRAEHHFLVDGIDAARDRLVRRCQRNRMAAPQHFAGGSGDDARQKLDQRRFAGTVFADDRVNFACQKRQRRRLQRLDVAVILLQALEFEDGRTRRNAVCLFQRGAVIVAMTDLFQAHGRVLLLANSVSPPVVRAPRSRR
jgi:hypothetical protein